MTVRAACLDKLARNSEGSPLAWLWWAPVCASWVYSQALPMRSCRPQRLAA